jgi:hypothetical protein
MHRPIRGYLNPWRGNLQRDIPHADTERGESAKGKRVNDLELMVSEAYDEGLVTEVIRPAAVMPEDVARRVLMELNLNDVRAGGPWWSEPSTWRRYDSPWDAPDGGVGSSQLLGTIQVAYGVPTRYEITIFRATITREGTQRGYTVESLCDEVLAFGGLTLADCPRADLKPPPKPMRA